ncbi:MAG TPA: AAA family ATPase [Kofleriaceae bacterium]|nr:AAA family ATPase [Kofleriaceae bacterium]
MRRTIDAYGGTLRQLDDGRTMAVIEPILQVATDLAARAARCALALHALAGAWPLAIAMGRVDSVSKLPQGPVIERAARLLAPADAAPPILVDEVVAGLLDARFDVVAHDVGWRLRGELALMQGTRTLLGRLTSCVGRDWELGVLAGIFDQCIDERAARAAMVIAAAGMGKSRLGAELVGRVREHHADVAIWVGRGDSLRAGSTLGLLAQALRGALDVHEGAPLEERREQVRARVAEHVPAAEQKRVTEFLAELVGAPFPGDDEGGAALRAARQDAQLMSEQMRRAWLDFLEAETSAHPILLVLEDLHWGDFGTVRFIDAALRERRNQPWMVLALARPEVLEAFPGLWAERHAVQEIRLKGLGRKASERLARQVLGDRVAPEVLGRLIDQADGNAFYLEELVRASAESKEQSLPETVLAMVDARLARLPPEARRVLRAASVFGEVCWEGGVSMLLGGGMAAASVPDWLTKLIEHEVLVARPGSRFPGERELAFRHVLLREGAYATLTDDNRRLGHHLAAAWLEQRGERDPMLLAGHFERGGDGAQAARHYLHAAEEAVHVLDLEAARARIGLGLGCAPSPELRMALLGLRCEVARSLQLAGAAMAEAEELLRAAPRDSLPWTQAMIAYSRGALQLGRKGELMAALGQLRDVTAAPAAVVRLDLLLLLAICIVDVLGQLAEGSALEAQFSELVRAGRDRDPLARCWWHTALGMRAAHAHDDPWSGLQHSAALGSLCAQLGGELMALTARLYQALSEWHLGSLELAEQRLAGIVACDEQLGMASSLRRFGLAWLLADRGALDAARAVATQLAEHGRAHRSSLEEGRGRWVLAEALRRAGDLAGADRELAVALELAVPLERPGVLGTLAALRLAQGRAAEALAAAEDAVARCAAMGGCGMYRGAFVRLAHAEALHGTGAHAEAQAAIAAARGRLVATADRIDDPEHRQRFLACVPENARTLALAREWLGEA